MPTGDQITIFCRNGEEPESCSVSKVLGEGSPLSSSPSSSLRTESVSSSPVNANQASATSPVIKAFVAERDSLFTIPSTRTPWNSSPPQRELCASLPDIKDRASVVANRHLTQSPQGPSAEVLESIRAKLAVGVLEMSRLQQEADKVPQLQAELAEIKQELEKSRAAKEKEQGTPTQTGSLQRPAKPNLQLANGWRQNSPSVTNGNASHVAVQCEETDQRKILVDACTDVWKEFQPVERRFSDVGIQSGANTCTELFFLLSDCLLVF